MQLLAVCVRILTGCNAAAPVEAGDYRGRPTVPGGAAGEWQRSMQVTGNPRWRNGAPWRDPDVWHVLAVGALAALLTGGLAYLVCLWRTWSVARRAGCHPADARSIILFGKRLDGDAPDREYRWRLRRALRLLRSHPHLPLLLTGGPAAGDGRPAESEVAMRWLLAYMPAAAHRLHVERRSRDTVDNLRGVRTLLPSGPVALLSNRYHLARCRLLARSLGLDVRVCAAEPALRLTRRNLARLALEAGYPLLFLVGRRWALLIGHRRMLSRVS